MPALRVGGERTAPIPLTVDAPSATAARARGPAWIEAEVDDASPYVQQAVGLRLRLYYSAQLLSGQLDQPGTEGIALQRAGSDVQYTREVGGRRYQVVERHHVLVPERSGRIELPAARFRGRGAGGWLDDLFGDGQRVISADGPPLVLDVQPVPAGAPQPWLPLHDCACAGCVRRRRACRRRGHGGARARAEGAIAAQVEPARRSRPTRVRRSSRNRAA